MVTASQKTRELFIGLQKKLDASLEIGRTVHHHSVTKGDATENDWVKMFREHLPTRYQATKGFVVDSKGSCSEQIDLIIYDRQYTPCLYNAEGIVYVPAESVYAVFEVKQAVTKDMLEYAHKKAESVRGLYRTSVPVTHVEGTAKSKPIHHILGGILALESEYSPPFSDSFQECVKKQKLDLGCCLKNGVFELSSSGEFVMHESDIALATFFMKLLGRLQSIGTVPAMDFEAYIKSTI